MTRYYSDQVRGARPRVVENFDRDSWDGVIAVMSSAIQRSMFAEDFPQMCADGNGPFACDAENFHAALRAEVPDLPRHLVHHDVPDTLAVLDLLQFMYRHASAPRVRDHHGFFGHDHLRFDRAAGRREMHEQINTLLARGGLAYELGENGEITHVSAPVVRELIRRALPGTGDPHLDALLQTARVKFTDRDPAVRREALEQAWHAFERYKTMLDPDKKRGADALIAAASSSPAEEALIREEMLTLKRIGNEFQIRHHETDKTPIDRAAGAYLFARIYAFLHWLHPYIRQPG